MLSDEEKTSKLYAKRSLGTGSIHSFAVSVGRLRCLKRANIKYFKSALVYFWKQLSSSRIHFTIYSTFFSILSEQRQSCRGRHFYISHDNPNLRYSWWGWILHQSLLTRWLAQILRLWHPTIFVYFLSEHRPSAWSRILVPWRSHCPGNSDNVTSKRSTISMIRLCKAHGWQRLDCGQAFPVITRFVRSTKTGGGAADVSLRSKIYLLWGAKNVQHAHDYCAVTNLFESTAL